MTGIEPVDEMRKLRTWLNERHIAWADTSDAVICRTHFYLLGKFYSVINGLGTYGGYDGWHTQKKDNRGLLEIYGDDFSEPIGFLTAQAVEQIIEERVHED